jgi:hypothetical protein
MVSLSVLEHITRLDCFFKKLLKQILSLPQNVADPVPYIISGLIPIEGQIHLKILTFMYNIFLLLEDSTEKKNFIGNLFAYIILTFQSCNFSNSYLLAYIIVSSIDISYIW